MLEQRQVTPGWADDPVRRHAGLRRRECRGRRGHPPPRKEIGQQEERVGQFKNRYVTISNGA